eukprot:312694-Chlamydomonas_euryale.AAC.1
MGGAGPTSSTTSSGSCTPTTWTMRGARRAVPSRLVQVACQGLWGAGVVWGAGWCGIVWCGVGAVWGTGWGLRRCG